jgi:3-keto-5-aminohexanoate cleavage enzyme
MAEGERVTIRLRMSQADAHYGGNLVDGARLLALFGDVATELLIRHDGDEGLFRAYESVEFLAPVHAGDYVEVTGEITKVGATSRAMRFEARKVIRPRPDLSESAAEALAEPVVVCRAAGTCVVPKDRQRGGGHADARFTRSGGEVAQDRPGRRVPAGEKAMGESERAIVTAAVVGAEVVRAQSPHVPYTPQEIAQAAVDAWRAGAAVIHLHARWPDGRPSQEASHFREIVDRIRAAGCDAVLQCSTGGAVGMSVDERLGSLVDGVEMGTLNLGTMNFGDEVFVNARPDIVRIAARLRERGLVPECEVYDAGMLDTLRWLLAKGHVAAPYHVQFVLGVPGGLSASERNLRFLVESLPEPARWTVAGVGRAELEIAPVALRLGGHVRVGLEDNLFLAKGILARGSHELVERAVALAREAGREPATPAEARTMLGIAEDR